MVSRDKFREYLCIFPRFSVYFMSKDFIYKREQHTRLVNASHHVVFCDCHA